MDPKALANLDPKLRETYERVMGASAGGATPSAPADSPAKPAGGPIDTFSTTPPIPTPGPVMFDATPSPSTPVAQMPAPVSPAAPVPPVINGNGADKTVNPSPTPPPPVAPVQENTGPAAPVSPMPDAAANPLDQPIQPAELASLQPSMTGAAVNNPSEGLQLSKPLQPLPSPATVNQPAAPVAASSQSAVMKTIYFIAAIVFFIVYAVFWLKIFKYPLPF